MKRSRRNTGMVLGIVACGIAIRLANSAPTDAPWQAYAAAITDARIIDCGEIKCLTPLKFSDHLSQTVVVSWAPEKYYVFRPALLSPISRRPFKESKEPIRLNTETWVFPLHDLQQKLKDYKGDDISVRLGQLLGLPPNLENSRLIIITVHKNNIFRPAYTRSVTTRESCAPDSEGKPCGSCCKADDTACKPDLAACKPDNSPEAKAHEGWMKRKYTASYPSNPIKGYPWTRLGYTYDWAIDDKTKKPYEHGVSEYVIDRGKPFIVNKIILNDEILAYIKNPGSIK